MIFCVWGLTNCKSVIGLVAIFANHLDLWIQTALLLCCRSWLKQVLASSRILHHQFVDSMFTTKIASSGYAMLCLEKDVICNIFLFILAEDGNKKAYLIWPGLTPPTLHPQTENREKEKRKTKFE